MLRVSKFTIFQKFILFGLSEENISDSVLDLVIIHAKFYICKLQNLPQTVEVFFKIFHSAYSDAKYLSQTCGNSLLFDLKWNPFLSLLD